MEVSWWQLIIIGPIIGGLAGGLSLFLSRLGYNYINKSKLDIEGKFTQENLTVDEKWTEIGVEVRNRGRSVAKNCRGVLTITNFASDQDIVDTRILKGDELEKEMNWRNQLGIEITKERARDLSKVNVLLDRKTTDIDFNEKDVPWNHTGTPINLDINKGDKNRLFVARLRWVPLHVGPKFDMIDIPSGYGWDKLHVILRPDKSYACTLKISSANADCVEKKFRLEGGRIYFD